MLNLAAQFVARVLVLTSFVSLHLAEDPRANIWYRVRDAKWGITQFKESKEHIVTTLTITERRASTNYITRLHRFIKRNNRSLEAFMPVVTKQT